MLVSVGCAGVPYTRNIAYRTNKLSKLLLQSDSSRRVVPELHVVVESIAGDLQTSVPPSGHRAVQFKFEEEHPLPDIGSGDVPPPRNLLSPVTCELDDFYTSISFFPLLHVYNNVRLLSGNTRFFFSGRILFSAGLTFLLTFAPSGWLSTAHLPTFENRAWQEVSSPPWVIHNGSSGCLLV
ncbi:hypothetical protein RRG08_025886 [Elysia crispata]|uniref:Uncharacterized protein n=1 Tax=Elysia crispata TaxID=231223 RepID=A0AAE1DKK0_9GAST|nr:hypothetical protein RRG08_025886 [Elysia crispata]